MRRAPLLFPSWAAAAALVLGVAGCNAAPPAAPPPSVESPEPPATAAATPDEAPRPEAEAGSGEAAEPSAEDAPTDGDGTHAEQAEEVAAAPSGTSQWNAATGWEPLNEATRALVWGTPEDAHPERLDASREDLADRHYLYSDEENLALYAPHLQNLGGAYMGVGTDQLYLLAGWMRPHLAFATDYDPWVRELHFIYLAAFEVADDIDSFLDFWKSSSSDQTRALLRERYADHASLSLLLEVHRTAARLVDRRLRRIRTMGERYDVPTFVTDPATYVFVRDLARAGRIRPAVINLLDDTGLTSLAEMLRVIGVPLHALYVSNAEEYWSYSPQFRSNIAAQNFGERGWLLRTSASKPANNDYRYYMQPGANFQAWLRESYVRSFREIYTRDSVRDAEHVPFRILDEEPNPRRARR